MKSTRNRRRHDIEVRYSKKAVAKKLRRLADALDHDRPLRLQIGGVRVRIPASVSAEMEYERGRNWEEIEIELRWAKQ